MNTYRFLFGLSLDGRIYKIPKDLSKSKIEETVKDNNICYLSVKFKDVENHPLRLAYMKFWTAISCNITERKYPRDITIDEAKDLIEKEKEKIIDNVATQQGLIAAYTQLSTELGEKIEQAVIDASPCFN